MDPPSFSSTILNGAAHLDNQLKVPSLVSLQGLWNKVLTNGTWPQSSEAFSDCLKDGSWVPLPLLPSCSLDCSCYRVEMATSNQQKEKQHGKARGWKKPESETLWNCRSSPRLWRRTLLRKNRLHLAYAAGILAFVMAISSWIHPQ